MKIVILVLSVIIAGCTAQKTVQKSTVPKINTKDSTSYELLVFDSGFDSWYTLKNSPALARSKAYYHDWNVRYVQAWNNKVMESHHSGTFSDLINYEFNVDYPYEIEHKLFYYFQYVEHELHIPILKQGPQSVF
jgi:hypothetical protein